MNELKQQVEQLVAQHGARLLHLCVCGSRAFGYASPQSDYDVRFIYVFPLSRYFSLTPPPEELHLEGADAVGYELGKFLRIAHKNGWNALEMLQAPAWYSHPCVDELRVLCREAFQPERAAHSLQGCALAYLRRLQHLSPEDRGGEKEAKLLLGALRTLLAANYALTQRRPYPLPMAELVQQSGPAELCDIVAQLTACRTECLPPSPELLAAAREYCELLRQPLADVSQSAEGIALFSPMERFYVNLVTSSPED